jgi:hypothetical protein
LAQYRIVFTSWIKSLDLVEEALMEQGLPFARIDGTCSAAQRAAAMAQFRDDAAKRVFLMTTGTGFMGSVTLRSLAGYILCLCPRSSSARFPILIHILSITYDYDKPSLSAMALHVRPYFSLTPCTTPRRLLLLVEEKSPTDCDMLADTRFFRWPLP